MHIGNSETGSKLSKLPGAIRDKGHLTHYDEEEADLLPKKESKKYKSSDLRNE